MTSENFQQQPPVPPIESPLTDPAKLPWLPGTKPLMLAPMQGLTNRALRSLFTGWVRPDVVWTEFMRVNPVSAKKRLMPGDLKEISPAEDGVPLVVQLIGHGREALVSAAQSAQDAGAVHINLNMGCPYGRMTSGLTGGGMLKRPELLEEIIPALREAIHGSFSIKLRAGYEDPPSPSSFAQATRTRSRSSRSSPCSRRRGSTSSCCIRAPCARPTTAGPTTA